MFQNYVNVSNESLGASPQHQSSINVNDGFTVQEEVQQTNTIPAMGSEPPLKRFRSLYSAMHGDRINATTVTIVDSVESDVQKYEECIRNGVDENTGIEFWQAKIQAKKMCIINKLATDLCAAPASEAFCERIFSVCGDFTMGKRNKTTTTLEMKVFMKLNMKYLPKFTLSPHSRKLLSFSS
jgi:hypothetical protein